MKKRVCALLIPCAVFCANLVFAQTTLFFPKTIQILAVNGKEISKPRKSIQLPDGKTQLLVRMVVDLGKRFDTDMEYSKTIIITFHAENKMLTLVAPEIKSAYAMKSFNKEMDLTLLDAENNRVALSKDQLVKSGFQFGRDYEQELARYNQTDAPAAIHSFAMPAQQTQPAANAATAVSATGNKPQTPQQTGVEKKTLKKYPSDDNSPQLQGDRAMAKKMLHYWYTKADEKTRQEFLQAITKGK